MDFNSLDAQRESAEALIESQKNEGWICLPDHYDDGGFTGGNMERPAMKRLMTDIEAEKIDCVVVYKFDRLSRSLMDFARIMEALEKQTTSFVSVTQQFNTTHSMGRLTLNILLSFAQFEREIISERTRDKAIAARKKGKWIGGSPVLGYDIDPRGGRLIINHEEAFKVRSAFELYQDHQSLTATAKELNRLGWTTKQWVTKKGRVIGGKPFPFQTVFKLLKNVTYLGKIKFNGEIYEGEHQAIIEEDQWQRVQTILKRNGDDCGVKVRNKYGALLKGLLFCKPCQAAMVHTFTGKTDNPKYRYYVCSKAQIEGWHSCSTKSVSAPDIEEFIVDRIRLIGRDSDLITETFNQLRIQLTDNTKKLESELWSVNEKIKCDTDEIHLLTNAKTIGFDDPTSQSSRLSFLNDQILLSQQRVENIREKIAKKKTIKVGKKELASTLEDFDPIWEFLSPREKERLVHLLVKKIDYDGANEMMSLTFYETDIKTLADQSPIV